MSSLRGRNDEEDIVEEVGPGRATKFWRKVKSLECAMDGRMGKPDEVLAPSDGPKEGYNTILYNPDIGMDPYHESQSRRQT